MQSGLPRHAPALTPDLHHMRGADPEGDQHHIAPTLSDMLQRLVFDTRKHSISPAATFELKAWNVPRIVSSEPLSSTLTLRAEIRLDRS